MARGGQRVGAGRPQNEAESHWLGGNAGKRNGREKPAALSPIATFEPVGLPDGYRVVWDRLAPHAFRMRTLTSATEAAFRDLCEAIVLRDGLMAQIAKDGYGDRTGKHPLLSDYRGMYQRVEAGMQKFRLSPMGKPIVDEVEKPVDPFAKFNGGLVQ